MVLQSRECCPGMFMLHRNWVVIGGLFSIAYLSSLSAQEPSDLVHAFYYPWYGNPSTDGRYEHWNHPVAVRKGPPRQFPGGDDIGANFYPALGCYSTNDSEVLDTHIEQLVHAGVGVISVSWWGRDSYTDRALTPLFQAAEKGGIQICFHLEPHLGPGGRNAQLVRDAIVYLLDKFRESPALYRDAKRGDRAVFYIYDSYLTDASEVDDPLTEGHPNDSGHQVRRNCHWAMGQARRTTVLPGRTFRRLLYLLRHRWFHLWFDAKQLAYARRLGRAAQ